MPVPITTVAEAIIAEFHGRYHIAPCPKQLEKLLYYAQGHHLATTGSPLFANDLEAWAEGPVCKSVFPTYAGVGKYDPIPKVSSLPTWLKPAQYLSVIAAVALLGHLSADEIGEMTHLEAPYIETWCNGAGRNNIIKNELIQPFFQNHVIVKTPMATITHALSAPSASKIFSSQGVHVDNEQEVKDYLITHPHLDAFLNSLVRRASSEISDPKEITVEVYKDAEIDHKYLSVTVRQPNYAADIMDKLDSIWNQLVTTMKPNLKDGTVNLMTDFAPPKVAHAA